MIYLDTSVALAQLLAEDRIPPSTLWQEELVSSRLLEYEIWTRINALELTRSHGEFVCDSGRASLPCSSLHRPFWRERLSYFRPLCVPSMRCTLLRSNSSAPRGSQWFWPLMTIGNGRPPDDWASLFTTAERRRRRSRMGDLGRVLEAVDGRPYPAYRDLRGRGYAVGAYHIQLEHVQGDPFACAESTSR